MEEDTLEIVTPPDDPDANSADLASSDQEIVNREIAERWCHHRGDGWNVVDVAGRGMTAPVFTLRTPDGLRALKLLDKAFSEGKRAIETRKRIDKQVSDIGLHDCPYVVQIYDGGRFEDRFFLLMNKAPGHELAKQLKNVPRANIATIVDQVAQACQFLRERGICHRDIKSANIFIAEDFGSCMLLDLSVARDIDDPVGAGTDHGNQLPIVATARYSPPEYLFRLVPPGPELWHAVDVYQLGGLLHDLIMRQEMFEEEQAAIHANRYRFAWIVATQQPVVVASDVDPLLVYLAQRCLDKNWKRRSQIGLDDFRLTKKTHVKIGMELLGFASPATLMPAATPPARQLLTEIASKLEERLREYFRLGSITAFHRSKAGQNDRQCYVQLEWEAKNPAAVVASNRYVVTFVLTLYAESDSQVDLAGKLEAHQDDGETKAIEVEIMSVPMAADCDDVLFNACTGAISNLAAKLALTQ